MGFAIIRVQKASTTSIQDYLHAHPAVCLPMGEIPCFESPDYEQGRASVQLSYTAQTDGKLAGMKRPNIFPDSLAGAPLPEGDLLTAESRDWLSAYCAADRARLQESHGDLVYC